MQSFDDDHSRRNLMATSMAFIAYYWAGGCFPPDTPIRLQVVNVSFKEPEVLAWMAWGLLFWFFLRYWQFHQAKVKLNFYEEIEKMAQSKIAKWYVKRKRDKVSNLKGDIHNIAFACSGGELVLTVSSEKNPTARGKINVEGYDGLLVKIISAIQMAYLKPGSGSYVLPYLLFVAAVIIGVIYEFILDSPNICPTSQKNNSLPL